MRAAGATIVDVEFPTWLLESRNDLYWTIRRREFRADIPDYPKTVADLVARSMTLTAPTSQGFVPNPRRWSLLSKRSSSRVYTEREHSDVEVYGVISDGSPRIASISARPLSSSRPAPHRFSIAADSGVARCIGDLQTLSIERLEGCPSPSQG